MDTVGAQGHRVLMEITLANLAKGGRRVVVQCGACSNRRLLKPVEFDIPMDTEVSVAGAVLKCGDCGSKSVLTYPEGNRDAHKGPER